MKMCPVCKVYLPDETEHCPLCRTAVRAGDDAAPGTAPEGHSGIRRDGDPETVPSPVDRNEQLTPGEKRRMAVELISVSLGIILIVTVGIDFIFSRGISWSRYTVLALALLWCLSAVPVIFRKHPALMYAVIGPSVLLLVFLWSLFSGGLFWFLPIGFPITVAGEIAIVSSYVLIAVQRRRGLNSVGVLLAAAVFFCAVIDASVSLFSVGRLMLTWSVVVCISAIPVAGLFFYLHYRVTNRASLRKLFRL